MAAAGKPAFIANVASLGTLNIIPEQTPYMMSTHAVLSFLECLYMEMAHAAAAIRVSGVLLGAVATRISWMRKYQKINRRFSLIRHPWNGYCKRMACRRTRREK